MGSVVACAAPDAPAPETMRWPDPLPPCAVEVPDLQKGLVIGSWVPDGPLGFEQAWVDETLTEASTRQKVARRNWRGFTSGSREVAMDALLNDRTGPAVGYLYSISVRGLAEPSVDDVPAVLHVRHRGRLRLWFDGIPVVDAAAPGPGGVAEARVPVVLRGRYGILLAKCGRGDDTLGASMDLEVRLSRPDGSPIEGQAWNSMRTPALYPDG